ASKRNSEVQGKVISLETALRPELVHPFRGRRRTPWNIGKSDLGSDSVDPIVDISLESVGARIVRDLPLAIDARADVHQESGFTQGQILVNSEIGVDALARGDICTLDIAVDFIGHGRDNSGSALLVRIPGHCGLKLVSPEPQADIVRRALFVFADRR